jgi:uncharacterized membrane protein YraQ (UPF0718 family)
MEARVSNSCHEHKSKSDFLLWGSLISIVILYTQHTLFLGAIFSGASLPNWLSTLSVSVFDLMNTIWLGLLIGVIMVAVLAKIPREFVMSTLGTKKGFSGIIRATAAGVLLDLCSHGILMVAAKLYERGASTGQIMAFLIASPWNSFSLTIILITLIGLPWTLTFIALSMIIAVISGLIFDALVNKSVLPDNPAKIDLPKDFKFWAEAKKQHAHVNYNVKFFKSLLIDGLKESRMVMRWILFGVLLAGLIRAFVSPEMFATFFGPTLVGLGLTVLVATIMEVCSEGSTPIAADLLTRAGAPGNSFAFLMTGVSTDYTEIMGIKETTRSWKIALFLPLVTVPQVLFISWAMNVFSV